VVVIGAGHNGLVGAVRLAEAGCDVTVVEAAAVPGGGVRSVERDGFVHDECAAFFPLAAASPAFRALELDVEWVNPAIAMAHVFEDGGEVALHRDLAATVASLEACAPGAGRAWRELVERLWPVRASLLQTGLERFPPLRPAARVARRLGPLGLYLAASSSAGLGRRLSFDARVAGWLAGSGAHADISPCGVGSGAISLGLNFLGHLVGWPFPREGAGRITEALVERLTAAGGELRCGVAAEAIETQPRAVRLATGERLRADAILCTASPAVLTTLLPSPALPIRLRRWRYGLGTIKLDYALNAPVPWLSSKAREAGVVHVGGPVTEIAESLERAEAGRFPDRPALVVGQQSLHDSTRAPQGRHTLYAYARVPRQATADAAELIEAHLERFAPGFRDTIIDRAVRTPRDIEERNPSMAGGDLASGSFKPDQQLILRPDPRFCRYSTPIQGLYVAGAWVHPGAGVHGMSGWNAAGLIARG
jgi:phytoene dehydrogenase-like protein